MDEWKKEFQYLLDSKILSRDELAYLLGQIKSILDRENKRLREDLIEFGGHDVGCLYPYDKVYGCKCGWLKVQQALRGK